MWFATAATFAAMLPLIATFGKLGGGFLALLIFVALAMTGVSLIGFGLVYAWRFRTSAADAAVSLVLPPIVVLLGWFLLPGIAEFSWQTLNGPRDVPIWPWDVSEV